MPQRELVSCPTPIYWCSQADAHHIHGDRILSRQWTSLTRFTILSNSTFRGYACLGRHWQRFKQRARPEKTWPENWSDKLMKSQQERKSASGRRKAKAQQCTKDESIFVDLEDMEVNETLNMPERSLKRTVDSAMPCKLWKTLWNSSLKAPKDPPERRNAIRAITTRRTKTVDACKCETHLPRKRILSSSHFSNLVHKLIPMHQAMRIPDAKAEVDKSWE